MNNILAITLVVALATVSLLAVPAVADNNPIDYIGGALTYSAHAGSLDCPPATPLCNKACDNCGKKDCTGCKAPK